MLLKKLDLEGFIASFKEEFAREKDVFLPGDAAFFYPIIKEFSNLDLAPAPKVKNLEKPLLHLQRSGVLGMEDIASFVKIALYFRYVKGLDLSSNALAWLEKIVLDPDVLALGEFFSAQGEFLQEKDERLSSLQRRQNELRASLKEHLHSLLSSPRLREFLVDSSVHYINDHETLLVRGGFARVLDASVAARSAGGFFYVIPRQSEIFLRQIQETQDKKLAVIYEYEQNFSKLLFGKLAFLRFLDREFDRLDHVIARAAFAKKRDLSLVKTTSKKQIILKNFIHPALKDPVPFSVDFSKNILMITGVNAGGKTMLLKSILSACFLAKHLIPFACDEAQTQIGSFGAIAAIINDDQSSADNISTFAARMREFSAVSKEQALLLGIDEIELGTDSDEAAALFKVMLEHLNARGAKIVITTHHKRLAALMAKHDFVELLAALFDEQKMLPLYGFMQGGIGNSYAFETALRYGIEKKIVDEARRVYGEDKIHLNLLIQKSSMLELEQTKRLQDLDTRRAELERHYEAKTDALSAQMAKYERFRAELELEYKRAIDAAKLAARQKTKEEIHKKLTEANKLQNAVSRPPRPAPSGETFCKNDTVKYLNSVCTILEIRRQEALIEKDGKRIFAPLEMLRRAPKIKPQKPKLNVQRDENSRIILDLHGLRAPEAIEKLDKFVSSALIAGYDELLIYHGIGTGVLSRVVKEFLKEHPHIKSFQDAHPSLGGFGATIAYTV